MSRARDNTWLIINTTHCMFSAMKSMTIKWINRNYESEIYFVLKVK